MASHIGAYCTRYLAILVLAISLFPRRNFVMPSKYNFLIGLNWFIGMVIMTILIKQKRWQSIFEKYIWSFFDIVFIAIFVSTYSKIYCRSAISFTATPRSHRSQKWNKFGSMVNLMLVAFLFFQVVPDISLTILYGFMNIRESKPLSGILFVCKFKYIY